MMKLNEFAEQVLTSVRDKADGDFNVWITTVQKNNRTAFTGITTSRDGSQAQPIVYLDGYYNRFIHNQTSVGEVSNIVYEAILEHLNYVPDIKITDLMDWERIKSRIYVKLINAGQNAESLEDTPHRFFLDFAIVYYIKVRDDEDGLQSITIKNQYLNLWGISEDELYRTGLKNLEDSEHILFKDMREILPPWLQTQAEPSLPMYVLTNDCRCYGASVLLLKNALKKISQRLGNLIILPSSLHELIVLPENQYTEDYEACAEMVKNINATVVLPEDYLSDHVYMYDSETLELRIAA